MNAVAELTPETRRRRHGAQATVTALAIVEKAVAAGLDIKAACRQAGISVPSYYRWRARRAGGDGRDLKREAILDAAKRVFLRDGYGPSLDIIAKAAGVARQTVYNQFGSKELLFAEVVRSVYQRLAGPVLVVRHDGDFIQTLTGFGRQFMKMAFDPESLALQRIALGEYRNAPELVKIAYALRAAHAIPVMTDFIADYLREQMEAGVIERADPLLAAEAFTGSFTAHARNRILVGVGGNSPERLDAMLNFCVGVFARGLGYRLER